MNGSQTQPECESADAPRQSPTSPPRRILVVDDDIYIRQIITAMLVRSGYHVDVAEDGSVAWDSLQLNNYHLLITDNNMPNVSGVELLRKLHAARVPLPVIMASGTFPEEEFTRHPELQPAAMLLKPFTAEELLETVSEVLRVPDVARDQATPPPDWQIQPPADGLRRR